MVKEVLRGILIALGFTISSPERISYMLSTNMASQVVLMVKNLSANAGDKRDVGLIPGLGRSPGGGHGNPLQYSCLGNPMDRRAWQTTSPWECRELDTTEHINKI